MVAYRDDADSILAEIRKAREEQELSNWMAKVEELLEFLVTNLEYFDWE